MAPVSRSREVLRARSLDPMELVKDERIRAAKIGKAVRISRHSLDDYMERQAYTGVEE